MPSEEKDVAHRHLRTEEPHDLRVQARPRASKSASPSGPLTLAVLNCVREIPRCG
jgi:hypothetical protein